ncbi:MAG: LysM peptidoglycan-binding domain-containing protein [Pseudohongiellaceae bacterium]
MKNWVIKQILLSIALLAAVSAFMPVWAQSSLLLAEYPDEYIVKDSDTLWDIAGQFLQDPERWSEIWLPDPYIDNSDLIYPNDILSVSAVGGSPRILLRRGGRETVNLEPQIREVSLSSAIPAIPLESIENSFTNNRIVSLQLFDEAPYIVSNLGDNLAIGTGDEVYARGVWPSGTASFEIYRQGRGFTDETGEVSLGLEVEYLGFATISDDSTSELKKLLINNGTREIRVGDRLLVREESRIDATIFPTEPAENLEGSIISFQGVETMASQLDTVIIDLGKSDNLVIGDILTIQQASQSMVDEVERDRMSLRERMRTAFKRDRLELPGKEIGTLLVYRTFDDLSYALILSSTEPAQLYNRVVSP